MYSTVKGNRASAVIIDCHIHQLYYGKFLAVHDSLFRSRRARLPQEEYTKQYIRGEFS